MTDQTIAIKNRHWFILALIGIAIAGVALFHPILLMLLLALLLTIALDIPVAYLKRQGLNRAAAAGVVIGMTAIIVTVFAVLIVPPLVQQGQTLIQERIPAGLRELEDWWSVQQQALARNLEDMTGTKDGNPAEVPDEVGDEIQSRTGMILDSLVAVVPPFFTSLIQVVVSIVILIFVVIMLLFDPSPYNRGFILLIPKHRQERAKHILAVMDNTLRQYIGAKVISVLFMGFGVWFLLRLIGAPEALILGVITGVTSVIPNFGPLMALVPTLAVASTSPEMPLLWALVIIYGMTFVQNQILMPILVAQAVKLPPVLVVFAQVIFGLLFGFLGILLAVPLLIIVSTLIYELYVVDTLGNAQPTDPTYSAQSAQMAQLSKMKNRLHPQNQVVSEPAQPANS